MYILLPLELHFWCTKLIYLKSAKLEQLIVYFMHLFKINAEVQLKIYSSQVYLIVLKWNYSKYTLGTL